VLADAGLGSRRQLEAWIAAGRVSVNGAPASIGQRITAADDVAVDGRPVDLAPREGCRVLVLNKAPGVICTRHDPEGRPTVFDDLPPCAAAAGSPSAGSTCRPPACCSSPTTARWRIG
jgi:23S rRNA pseudouridine2605 synthase